MTAARQARGSTLPVKFASEARLRKTITTRLNWTPRRLIDLPARKMPPSQTENVYGVEPCKTRVALMTTAKLQPAQTSRANMAVVGDMGRRIHTELRA